MKCATHLLIPTSNCKNVASLHTNFASTNIMQYVKVLLTKSKVRGEGDDSPSDDPEDGPGGATAPLLGQQTYQQPVLLRGQP